jgi:hypothetical protein
MAGCGSAPTAGDLTVTWTAPGDDGTVGTCAEYDIRYNTVPITTANWNTSTQVSGEPVPDTSGTQQWYTFPPLPSGTYYVGIKARDEAFNWSALSNVIQVTVDNVEPSTIGDFREAGP